jgi:hypothetical protein
MAETPGLRVSDEQRERVAQEIREHFAAGRLSDEELDERVQAAYRARTEDQLRAVRSDLPELPISPEQRRVQERAELAERRAVLQRQLFQQTGGGLGLFVVCTAIWLASGAQGQFWPVWVLLVALIALLRNGWRLYGPAPELDRVEEELRRRGRRGRVRERRRELRDRERGADG